MAVFGVRLNPQFIQNWGFGATGIVWLRIESHDSETVLTETFPFAVPALSEYHHSLATACLVDDSLINDGWGAVNRKNWSSGAGITSAQSVFWNIQGAGRIESYQSGWGYVIGTDKGDVLTSLEHPNAKNTAPEDWTEGIGEGALLEPSSLYEDQLSRRLGD